MRRFIQAINVLGEAVDLFDQVMEIGETIIGQIIWLVLFQLLVIALVIGSFWIPDIPLHHFFPGHFKAPTIVPVPRLFISLMVLMGGEFSLIRDVRAFIRDIFEQNRDESFARCRSMSNASMTWFMAPPTASTSDRKGGFPMLWLGISVVLLLLYALWVAVCFAVVRKTAELSEQHRYEGRLKTTVRRGRPIGTLRDAQDEYDELGPPGDVPDFLRPR